MMQGFYKNDPQRQAVFDMFFRRHPFGGGYAIFAGLEPLLEVIENFRFSDNDINYLASLKTFSGEFLEYLASFRFKGEIYAAKEGSVVFPNEPLLRIHGTMLEAQLIEPVVLNYVNFQTLIATKSARVCEAAGGSAIMEFGLRRAQGVDGAVSAARAAFVGGAKATSNVLAGRLYGIPVRGTMAHSWVMSFPSEAEAFEAFADMYPNDCILLVDTYDTLRSGVPNAVKIFKELQKKGIHNFGIRLDSGDLGFLSREARAIFEKEGVSEAKIVASNDLDEWVIEQLRHDGAMIDSYGVGTRLVTADKDPSLTGVYKLAAKHDGKEFRPAMKVTNNPEKMSNPDIKNVYRFFDSAGMMLADLVLLESSREEIDSLIASGRHIRLNHPSIGYSYAALDNYAKAVPLLEKVMGNGRRVNPARSITEIQQYAKEGLDSLHGTYKRLLNPHVYKVSLSCNLKKLKMSLVNEYLGE
jgi:nicotinate phosphoribosyltransferase